MLGRTLAATAPAGVELHVTVHRTGLDLPHAHRVDLRDRTACRELVGRLRPAVVVHTAYAKDEDGVLAPSRHVAAAAGAAGAGLVHLSSDVVFDGERSPYAETDAPAAVSAYGRWKADAERAVGELVGEAALVRCSLVVSRSTDPGGDHLDRLLPGSPDAGLFVDELRQPIGAVDLARQLWEIVALERRARSGVWHLAGPEVLSRYALGLLVTTHRGEAARPPAHRDAHPGVRPRELVLRTDRARRTLVTTPRPVSALLAPSAGETVVG